MELKQVTGQWAFNIFSLLIVPYGIETALEMKDFYPDWLLIVPYGIETVRVM